MNKRHGGVRGPRPPVDVTSPENTRDSRAPSLRYDLLSIQMYEKYFDEERLVGTQAMTNLSCDT